MKLLNSSEVLDSFTPRHTPAPSPQCLGWGLWGDLFWQLHRPWGFHWPILLPTHL